MVDIVSESLSRILNDLDQAGVKLIAISKTKPVSAILEGYEKGHKVFGENRVQELVQKQQQLPDDIEWHMVGHLQTNKVKLIAPFINYIHSVDSLKLLKAINQEASKNDRIINCLLQIYIAEEATKYGLSFEEANSLLLTSEFKALHNIKIVGLMGMATFTDNSDQIRREFHALKEFYDKLGQTEFKDNPEFKELSMGMSGDYKIAIEEGSTMVRIGSLIFGERN
ncbi:YggS family pyridoxal phosphate-dependent enzyme [Candidatus Amoebophilus asiaticus]|nr:YggS family pyridoxal phosphate-dependent enzyme [Candidatus Amoebophilus asiaticus]